MFGNKNNLDLFLMIKKHPAFDEIAPKFWPQIENSLTRVNLNYNQEILLTEDDNIYFLVSGTVEVFEAKEQQSSSNSKTIYTGEIINVMNFFNENLNIYKILAVESTVLIKLNKKLIEKIKPFPNILKNISKYLYSKLNYSEDILEKSAKTTSLMIQHELREEKIRTLLAKFFITAVSFYACFILMLGLIMNLSPKGKFFDLTLATSKGIIELCLVSILFKILTESIFKYSDLGFTLNNVSKNIIESLAYSVFICVAFTALKYIIISNISIFKHLSLFDFKINYIALPYISILAYTLHASLQEIFVRCLAQVPLTFLYISAFVNSYSKISTLKPICLGIVISNLIFSSIHALNSFSLAISTFFLGIFWGWLFYKQKSIIGPIVSHAIIGNYVIFFLNIDPML